MPESSDQLTIREALESQGDLPFLVITVAAVVGTILLLLNIILIGCFVHKKNKNKAKKQQRAPSSEGKMQNKKSTNFLVEGTCTRTWILTTKLTYLLLLCYQTQLLYSLCHDDHLITEFTVLLHH